MTNYDKPYKFNIVLNSLDISELTVGNNRNNLTYEFNWTNIPRGAYKMSFSYRGLNNADFVANDSPQLFLSLGSVPSVFQASGETGSVISYYIGTLRAETHAAAQVYFYANLNDNPDVYFESIPTNGLIQITIFKSDFVTPFATAAASQLSDYVMVLSFEQVGKVVGYSI
jgi:hypothetical protein